MSASDYLRVCKERDSAVVEREKMRHQRNELRRQVGEAIEMLGKEISNGTDWIGVDGDPNHALAILRAALEAKP